MGRRVKADWRREGDITDAYPPPRPYEHPAKAALRSHVEWCREEAEDYARQARLWPESADEFYGNRDALERAADHAESLLGGGEDG